ncbi:MAG: hypothetical protein HQM10_00745 [Candidatus Riflebacteria bacterium]|nr:hypothetical protein [Candidatus Riflebacteria bacterium]
MKSFRLSFLQCSLFFLLIFLSGAFLGCLGLGGSGSGGISQVISEKGLIRGKLYYKDRSLYGGIPVIAKNALNQSVDIATTDSSGNFIFQNLPAGVYDFYATDGESETLFGSLISVQSLSSVDFSEINLLALSSLQLTEITSSSAILNLEANQYCASGIEIETFGASFSFKLTSSLSSSRKHSYVISELAPSTRYLIKITLYSDDGQKYSYSGTNLFTTSGTGPEKIGISINQGAVETRDSSLLISLNAKNASEMRIGNSEDFSGSYWEPFSNYRQISLSKEPGTRRVYVQFRDSFGNLSPVIYDSILFSGTKSGYIGVWIEGGAAATNKSEVTLTFYYPGASHVRISESSSFSGAYWEYYVESRKWTFQGDDGIKRIYVQFKGGNADPEEIFSAQIDIDRGGPVVTMKVNQGAKYSNSPLVNLSFAAGKAPIYMQIVNDVSTFSSSLPWLNYVSSFPWSLSWSNSSEDGLKTVYARFLDRYGNYYGPISASLTVDTIPPQNASLSINGNVLETTSLNVSLALSAEGAENMIISNSSDFSGAQSEKYSTKKDWTLGSYGTQTVYVKYFDAATNSTSIISKSIYAITPASETPVLRINGGDPTTENISAHLDFIASGALRLRLSQNQNFQTASDIEFVSSMSWQLSRTSGEQVVYGRFEFPGGFFLFASDSIQVIGPSSPTISLVDSAPVASTNVNLSLFCMNAQQMLLTENYNSLIDSSLFQPYNIRKTFTIGDYQGKHTVWAKFRNSGGVDSSEVSVEFIASIPHTVTSLAPTIAINNGDPLTYNSSVLIYVTAPGQSIMWLSNDGSFSTATPTAPARVSYSLPFQAGSRTVYARFLNSVGEYFYAQDSILAVGPASASISTRDSQPLNSNFVNLDIWAEGASDMIVSEDLGAVRNSIGWTPFRSTYVFPIVQTGALQRTIYAKFKNPGSDGIESETVQAAVQVRNTAPASNTATFRLSPSVNSSSIDSVGVGSLPVYLHFDIKDASTATVTYQLATAGSPAPSVFIEKSSPVAPVPFSFDSFNNRSGAYNIWYKTSDKVGNTTPFQIITLDVQGPMLTVSPRDIQPLHANQTQQFTATQKNISGEVRWDWSPRLGVLDTITGKYTAPSLIEEEKKITIRAYLPDNSSIFDEVVISLVTDVYVTVSPSDLNISVGSSTQLLATFWYSSDAGTVVLNPNSPYGGIQTITNPVQIGSHTLATVTYTAPSSVPATNPVILTVLSRQDPSKTATATLRVNSGPYINLIPSSLEMRVRGEGKNLDAYPSEVANTMTWTAKNSFFDAEKTQTTKTTNSPSHRVTVYPPNEYPTGDSWVSTSYYSATASANITSTASITYTSAISVSVSPLSEEIWVGTSATLIFSHTVENASTTQVKWEYKNSATTTWTPAGAATKWSDGSITTAGVYTPPATFPNNDISLKYVNIRAVSQEDSNSFSVATITLLSPVEVRIYEGYNAISGRVATEATATLEVGTIQFFAEVKNLKPGQNMTVKWMVENIEGGSSNYGTVDTTGKYYSPDNLIKRPVYLKAVSNQFPTVSGSCSIYLPDFWTSRSKSLIADTNATFSINCIIIDQTTSAAGTKNLYCGTDGNGFYYASVDAAPLGDWKNISWTGAGNLFSTSIGNGAKYLINSIAMSRQNPERIVAGTLGGLFVSTDSGRNFVNLDLPGSTRTGIVYNEQSGLTFSRTVRYDDSVAKIISGVAIDQLDDRYLYVAAKNQGIIRYIWDAGQYKYSGTLYDDRQRMTSVVYQPAISIYQDPATYTFQAPTVATFSASGTVQINCLALDPKNPEVLYAGVSNYLISTNPDVFYSGYLRFNSCRTGEYVAESYSAPYVGTPPPAFPTSVTLAGKWLAIPYTIKNLGGVVLSMAVDPNTPTTVWAGKNDGIYRTTDDGNTWTKMNGTNTLVNIRGVLIDPINTVNVYIGTESGLYRSPDAGVSWKQIKSGLEGHTTINSFSLSPGGWGERRIFSGTTAGLFMGETTLDLP